MQRHADPRRLLCPSLGGEFWSTDSSMEPLEARNSPDIGLYSSDWTRLGTAMSARRTWGFAFWGSRTPASVALRLTPRSRSEKRQKLRAFTSVDSRESGTGRSGSAAEAPMEADGGDSVIRVQTWILLSLACVIMESPHSWIPRTESLCACHFAIGRMVRVEVTATRPEESAE